MPLIAVSVVDVLLALGLGAAGFLVVALVCAAVLAMLHLVLPAADSGAAAIDRAALAADGDGQTEEPPATVAGERDIDKESNA